MYAYSGQAETPWCQVRSGPALVVTAGTRTRGQVETPWCQVRSGPRWFGFAAIMHAGVSRNLVFVVDADENAHLP